MSPQGSESEERPSASDHGPLLADENAPLLGDDESEHQSKRSPVTQPISGFDIAVYISYFIALKLGQTFPVNAFHQVGKENLCRELHGRTDAGYCGAADDVQSELAVLMGWYTTAQLIPGVSVSIALRDLLCFTYGPLRIKPFIVLDAFKMAVATACARIICDASIISVITALSYGPRLITTVVSSKLLELHGPWPLLWGSLACSFFSVFLAFFFIEPNSAKDAPVDGGTSESSTGPRDDEPTAPTVSRLKARSSNVVTETNQGFSYVLQRCNAHVISYLSALKIIVTLVSSSLILSPGASYIMTAKLKLGTAARDLTIARVCGLMFLLGGGLMALSPTGVVFAIADRHEVWAFGTWARYTTCCISTVEGIGNLAMVPFFAQIFKLGPHWAARQDIVSYGTTSRIVLDRRTQTIIKWPNDARSWRGILQEKAVYERLQELGGHPWLLTYYGGVETYGLRLEYAAMTDLRSHIRYKGIGHPLESMWMVQIAQALEFVHAAGIIHGGVLLSHVMLDALGNAKLADFAWCGSFGSNTPLPRILASHEYPGNRLTVKGDLFALGSALYELKMGSEPFVTLRDQEIRARFRRGEFPDVRSLGALGNVISKCWRGSYESTTGPRAALEGIVLNYLLGNRWGKAIAA
ncbi:hypothetical protein LLEC1_00812 [Akanthomyces lecanii]|uniref:non-specific serine/threonine protein kinase n=1 Tax=Cordyceps confragosa TaxID=2714763 RepID=A0A179ICT2_CORDF|nr:hypothetical protein LLEC1_00812 [Akanthomyces lecanii]